MLPTKGDLWRVASALVLLMGLFSNTRAAQQWAHDNLPLSIRLKGDAPYTRVAPRGPHGRVAGSALGRNIELSTYHLVFASPRQGPEQAKASLENYRYYARFPRAWSVSGCDAVADAHIKFDSTSDLADVSASPKAAGHCSISVTAARGRYFSLAAPAQLAIDVMSPLQIGGAEDNAIMIAIPSVRATAVSELAYKTYDDQPLQLSLSGANCAKFIEFKSTPQNVPQRATATASTALAIFSPRAEGVCSSRIRDQYGSNDTEIALQAVVMGDLSLSPLSTVSQETLNFRNGAETRRIVLYKQFETSSIAPHFAENGCAALAGFYLVGSSAPKKPSTIPAKAILEIRPANFGTCTAFIADDYPDDPPVAVHIRVPLNLAFYSPRQEPRAIHDFVGPREVSVAASAASCGSIARLSNDQSDPGDASTSASGLTVFPLSPGVCTTRLDMYDSGRHYHDRMTVSVMGDISFALGRVVDKVSVAFRSPTSASQSISLYKAFDDELIVPHLVFNGCSAIVGFYPTKGRVSKGASSAYSSTTISLKPVRAGKCHAILGDQYGAKDLVRVDVLVGKAR